MEALRTPGWRFADLPGFPYAARTRDWDGLRLAHVDEGEGPPVVLLHGQPTWSYLFRDVIARLVACGFRAIAPDLPGFGRSDKPVDPGWYSFARHVASLRALLETLDLRDVTLVMHDWGGPMGVRLATVEAPERIARLVALDTSIVPGRELGEEWQWFRGLVASREVFPVGRLVRMGCAERPAKAVVAAYDAPFPDERFKAGVRAFPALVPVPGETVTRPQMDEAVAALRGDARPALLLWGEADPIFPVVRHGPELEEILPQAGPVRVFPGTGHFLPEERGAEIADAVAGLISGR
jgi:haloalkane dehalogenase